MLQMGERKGQIKTRAEKDLEEKTTEEKKILKEISLSDMEGG